ncbi:MAG: YceI family protein [Pseudomonadota bacterium]
MPTSSRVFHESLTTSILSGCRGQAAVEQTGPTTGTITGDLNIKGNVKPVTLDVTFNKADYNQRGERHKIGFSGTTKVLRSDFDVDLAVPFVGDEVSLIIEVEFDEQNPS